MSAHRASDPVSVARFATPRGRRAGAAVPARKPPPPEAALIGRAVLLSMLFGLVFYTAVLVLIWTFA
jgi:hypothetical protein